MQLQTIFAALPAKRQTLLFSATITDTLNKLKEVALNNVIYNLDNVDNFFSCLFCNYKFSILQPFMWSAVVECATVEELDQRYVLTPADFKDGYLILIVQHFRAEKPSGSIIIFTDTCK